MIGSAQNSPQMNALYSPGALLAAELLTGMSQKRPAEDQDVPPPALPPHIQKMADRVDEVLGQNRLLPPNEFDRLLNEDDDAIQPIRNRYVDAALEIAEDTRSEVAKKNLLRIGLASGLLSEERVWEAKRILAVKYSTPQDIFVDPKSIAIFLTSIQLDHVEYICRQLVKPALDRSLEPCLLRLVQGLSLTPNRLVALHIFGYCLSNVGAEKDLITS